MPGSSAQASLLALLTAGISLGALGACERKPPPGARPTPSATVSGTARGPAGDPTLPEELEPQATATLKDAGVDAPPPKHEGPWFVVTSPAAGVYPTRDLSRDKKLGYIRNGGKVGVKAEVEKTKSCTSGWHELVSGGYVCGNLGTIDLKDPKVKFALKQPDLDSVLPYTYARNAKNGTPLYRSVPSKDQMHRYEPYLPSAKKAREKQATAAAKRREASDQVEATAVSDDGESTETAVALRGKADGGATPPSLLKVMVDAGLASSDEDSSTDDDTPWWQQDGGKESLHKVTLEQLEAESDDILAKRMVAGFYIAVDKTFRWNGRLWYKSTKGLIGPADRFWQTAGSTFKGVELGQDLTLPIGWVYGGRKTAPTYELSDDGKKLKPAKAVERFEAIALSGNKRTILKNDYYELKNGTWIRAFHIRVTEPGDVPADVGANERWIDVNRSQQTLVAFQGKTPVYATMVSTGKPSTVKDKDHRTPTGQWRIREKHLTTTMDGNGSAAGDLPYSIEDVPFVMYYDGSYAVHGAFWHRNFGITMSHGCTNVAPLDAKHLFFWSEPRIPEGWHGAWSRPERPGSRVIVHD